MFFDSKILIGKTSDTNEKVFLYPKMANRHGLIAGATGTGKTITLKYLQNHLVLVVFLYFWQMQKGTYQEWDLQVRLARPCKKELKKWD